VEPSLGVEVLAREAQGELEGADPARVLLRRPCAEGFVMLFSSDDLLRLIRFRSAR
jgi:hypothetical protein